jgi:predicted nuclease with TOPRIM domain
MARYDDWSKEDLAYKCRRLEDEVERLNEKIRQMDIENSSLSYRIKNELEPRIASERRAYDRWVTNPERQ